MAHYKIRRQRPIKGGRVRGYVGLDPHTADIVQATMKRFRVSQSFVLSVMASEVSGNTEVETFLPVPKSGVQPRLADEIAHPRPRLIKRRA